MGLTRVTFVNMHLPAGEGQNVERCQTVVEISRSVQTYERRR